ncbi:MAG TPA: SDR family oxidoreductase [Albitalea sp.]
MKVLLTGATGFIGSRLRAALLSRGHAVVAVARHPPACANAGETWIALDMATATSADWQGRLLGVDAVVNAVGIFRERGAQTFDALHIRGPQALFTACMSARVRRVVQLSALGADLHAGTAYHRSKRAADDMLLGLPLDGVVAQPSLVFGEHGPSAKLFLSWASLPVLPLPARGEQMVQPVHVDDVVDALVALTESDACSGLRVPLVGPRPLSLAAYLQALRESLGLPPASTVSIAASLMARAARLGDHLPAGLLDTASWKMLQRGNAGPADAITQLLQHAPREARHFVPADHADAYRGQARLGWLLPVLRWSLAIVWIVTGIVSFGLYPREDSFELLARAGVPASLQPLMLYGAATLDLLFGLACIWPMRRRRWLWSVQAGLILVYTAIISIRLPEFWLHPYGPVLKNVVLLAVLLLLAMLEPPERRR